MDFGVSFDAVWVPEDAVLGPLEHGLAVTQHFVHENRIRQAASSLGAADYCVRESVAYARQRMPFGRELALRHHRRYRITEGSEEIQIRKIAGHLFGYVGQH